MKRSITSAAVVAALLIGVACSGGGNVTPGARADLPTVQGPSPASVEPAPMVRTAILPSSAMASRTPATSIVPQNWTQIPGTASEVTAAADGSIWVLSDQPAGPDKNIWHYSGGTWTNIGGLAEHIAVAPDLSLWAINSAGGIYHYSGGAWTGIGGLAQSLATLADNSVVVASNSGGAAGNRALWKYAGGTFTQVPGSGAFVTGSIDPSPQTTSNGTLQPGGFYIINGAQSIYYENPDGSFVQIPSTASYVASSPGGLFAFGPTFDPSGNAIFYFDTTSWSTQTGAAVSVSVANGTLFVVAGTGAIFSSSIVATPTPTASPTPTPAPLAVDPNPISLTQTGNANVTVTEAGYNGTIAAVSGDTGILTVVQSPVTSTAGSATVVVTAVGAGSTTLTVSDTNGQQVVVPVHVTITGVVISGSH